MSRFEGQICPACKKVFGENDDIVVCPECGAPHHRECYLKNGKCAMEEIHGDYEWHEEIKEQSEPETSYDIIFEEKRDPIYLNPIRSYSDENERNSDRFSRDETEPPEPPEPPIDSEVQSELSKIYDINFLYDGEDMPESNTVVKDMLSSQKKGRDGVSMLELTFFTGVSLMHYVGPFIRFMRTERTNGFNLSSGLFMPIHQFFRKMDGWGALLLLFIAIGELVPRILYDFGILPYSALNWAFIGIRVLFLLLTVLMCLFGDRIYYKHAVKRILKIRRHFEGKTDTVEYFLAIKDEGGTSFFRGIFGLLANVFCVVLANILPSMLI